MTWLTWIEGDIKDSANTTIASFDFNFLEDIGEQFDYELWQLKRAVGFPHHICWRAYLQLVWQLPLHRRHLLLLFAAVVGDQLRTFGEGQPSDLLNRTVGGRRYDHFGHFCHCLPRILYISPRKDSAELVLFPTVPSPSLGWVNLIVGVIYTGRSPHLLNPCCWNARIDRAYVQHRVCGTYMKI